MEINDKTFVLAGTSIAISVALSAVVSWYLISSHIETFKQNQPQIAIAGYDSVRKQFELNTPQEVMAASYEDLNQKIDRLKDLGYLVIDERVVMTAPDNMRVPVRIVSPPESLSIKENESGSGVDDE